MPDDAQDGPEDPRSPEDVARTEAQQQAHDDLAALGDMDRSNKVGRTVQQAGLTLSVVVVIDYVASFFDVDLSPVDPVSVGVPVAVVAAVGTIGAWAMAKRMNRPRG